MHRRSLRHHMLLAITVGLLQLLIFAPAHAADEPPFKETMLKLLSHTQSIVEGIMRSDYNKVANMAEAIAFHQGPSPSKRMAITNELGIEAMTFTLFDNNLRNNANSLKKAADKRDQKAVISTFAELMQSCTNCHNSYRKRLRTLD